MKKHHFYRFVLFLFIVISLGCGSKNEMNSNNASYFESHHVLQYIAQPMFSSGDLLEQISNTRAHLELLNLSEKKVYFSLSRKEDKEATIQALSKNPDKAEFAIQDGSRLVLGNYSLRNPDLYFFRINIEDFEVSPDVLVSVPFSSVVYTFTPRELSGFILNESVVGGKKFARFSSQENKQDRCINFAAYVARQGEPSLQRLVHDLIGNEKNQEKIMQKLLDFVTNEIEYDHDEKEWSNSTQVIKRPNETLMTKRATCAGKAVLYASLLNQLGYQYLFAYYPNHLSIFVLGDFQDSSDQSIKVGNKVYSRAEPTVPDFQIGETQIVGGQKQPLMIQYSFNQEILYQGFEMVK